MAESILGRYAGDPDSDKKPKFVFVAVDEDGKILLSGDPISIVPDTASLDDEGKVLLSDETIEALADAIVEALKGDDD